MPLATTNSSFFSLRKFLKLPPHAPRRRFVMNSKIPLYYDYGTNTLSHASVRKLYARPAPIHLSHLKLGPLQPPELPHLFSYPPLTVSLSSKVFGGLFWSLILPPPRRGPSRLACARAIPVLRPPQKVVTLLSQVISWDTFINIVTINRKTLVNKINRQ